MDFSKWLTPDDVMGRLLVGVFGPIATIVAALLLADVIWSCAFFTLDVTLGRRIDELFFVKLPASRRRVASHRHIDTQFRR
jgi:hypothetical protein